MTKEQAMILVWILLGALITIALCVVARAVSKYKYDKKRMKEYNERSEKNNISYKPLHKYIPRKGTYISLDNGASWTLFKELKEK